MLKIPRVLTNCPFLTPRDEHVDEILKDNTSDENDDLKCDLSQKLSKSKPQNWILFLWNLQVRISSLVD